MLLTELVQWTSSVAVLLDFANIFCPMYLRHSLQVAINVGEHFNSRGHSISDMRFVAIEQIRPMGDTLLRRQRERLWINIYDSIEFGGNKRR